jgi:nitrate reductase beta subunit
VLRGSSGFGFRESTLGNTKVNLFGGGSNKAKREPRMDIAT